MLNSLKRGFSIALCSLFIMQSVNASNNKPLIVYLPNMAITKISDDNITSKVLQKDEVEKIVRQKLNLDKNYIMKSANMTSKEFYIKQMWNLDFYNENNGNSINVTVKAVNGEILNYRIWDNIEYDSIIKITKDEARTVAVNYIKSVYPDRFNQLKEVTEDEFFICNKIGYYQNGKDYKFAYVPKILNKYIFPGNYIMITVSGTTGKIIKYETNWDDSIFTPNKNILTEQEARKIFEKQATLTLKYIRKTSDKDKKVQLIPVYEYNLEGTGILDAKQKRFLTGEEIFYKYKNNFYSNTNDKLDLLKEGNIREENINETIPEKGVISKEKAIKIVIDKVKDVLDLDKMDVENSFYNSQYGYKTRKFWNIYWSKQKDNKYMRACLDAETGQILSIHYGDIKPVYYNNTKLKVTKLNNDLNTDKIKKDLTSKIIKMFPEIKNTEYDLSIDTKSEQKNVFKSPRYINGIPYESNNVLFEVNTDNMKIDRFSFNWDYNIEVKKTNKLISKNEANKIFFDTVGFDNYLIQLKDQQKVQERYEVPLKDLALVFMLKPYYFRYIDAEGGTLLNYDGKTYEETKEIVKEFDDIAVYKYEKAIKLMNKMGLIQEVNKSFMPNIDIKKKDAIKWLVLTLERQHNYIPRASRNRRVNYNEIKFKDLSKDDPYYEYAVSAVKLGIIDKTGDYFLPNLTVKKINLVKWIINGLGQQKLAQYTDIFKLPYEISSILQRDIGYVALADYYNIFGNSKYINYNDHITRGEYIKNLYDLMLNLGI